MLKLHSQSNFPAKIKVGFASIEFLICKKSHSYRTFQTGSHSHKQLLQQCRTLKCVNKIHARIITAGYWDDPFVGSKLIGKYAEYAEPNLENARKVLDRMSDKDVFLWNVVIQGYAGVGPFREGVCVYKEMRMEGVVPNEYTFPFVLKACAAGAAEGGRRKGEVVHGDVVKFGYEGNLYVGNAFVAFYSKCGDVESSKKVFEEITLKDVVSYNSLISGYTVNGCVDEAIKIFHGMFDDCDNCVPDRTTFVSVLPACAQAAAIREGFWIHAYIIKLGLKVDAALGSGLISMYGNCGRVNVAKEVFDRISAKNIMVWNAMIRCYGMHGFADEALKMFSDMLETGLCPDGVIFLCLLSACSHVGTIAKGRELFDKMEDYGVEKGEKHYACMVDLLGRAGYLDDAVELIKSMPMKAGKDVYGALLGACRIHRNVELAEEVAEKLFVLDPDNAGRYILLAQLYEDLGRLEDAARIRLALRGKQIQKPTGCSSIEVDSIHHTFGVEDKSHPFTEQIFDTVIRLDMIMEEEYS